MFADPSTCPPNDYSRSRAHAVSFTGTSSSPDVHVYIRRRVTMTKQCLVNQNIAFNRLLLFCLYACLHLGQREGYIQTELPKEMT